MQSKNDITPLLGSVNLLSLSHYDYAIPQLRINLKKNQYLDSFVSLAHGAAYLLYVSAMLMLLLLVHKVNYNKWNRPFCEREHFNSNCNSTFHTIELGWSHNKWNK